ncbi:MAG TPA: phosphonate metabolism protein/1,5-bisphosphokinase (PRPP-forming) PhnN [Microbacterium sp.]|nr:phosphonate metabolism protein/1,5-bisphosphokinase (PRPP-forming) PhnN [Microbacterium sp.]
MTGALVAVVGPSGSGKDAVIDCARAHFEDDARLVFPQRVITRPAGAGEDHIPVSEAEFAGLEDAGDFAVHWDAHGLRYGVPRHVADAVEQGCVAVVNVSRAAMAGLDATFSNVHVVRVTVAEEVRRARILSRGRETSDDALARLNRPDPAPGHPVALEIVNDRALTDAGDALVAFLEEVVVASGRRRGLRVWA